MNKYSGTYNSKVSKGICFLPSPFRKKMPKTATDLKVRVTEGDKYLEIYEDSDWDERIEDFEKFIKDNNYDRKKDIMREYTASAVDVDIDTKPKNAGRMRIPEKMLEKVGIKNEVIFVGTKGMVLMWDKEKYENRPAVDLQSIIEKYDK